MACRTTLTMAETTSVGVWPVGGLFQVQHFGDFEIGERADDAVFHELDAQRVSGLRIQAQQDLAATARRFALAHLVHPAFVQQLAGDLGDSAHAEVGMVLDLSPRKRALTPDDIEDEVAVQRLDQVAITTSWSTHSVFSFNEIRLCSL